MKGKGALLFAGILLAAVTLPQGARAADEDLQKKLDALTKEVQSLQRQMAQSKETAPPKEGKKSISDWLTIGGDYRLKVDSLRGEVADFHQFTGFDPSTGAPVVGPLQNAATVKNDTILTNRFGLNLKAKATRNVTVTARMLMYKTFGSQDDTAVTGLQSVDSFGNRVVTPFFGDRVGTFDGTQGHLPGDGRLTVDQAYVTWTNILDQPIWFSVGTPSLHGRDPDPPPPEQREAGGRRHPRTPRRLRLRRRDAGVGARHRRASRRVRQALLRPRIRERHYGDRRERTEATPNARDLRHRPTTPTGST